MGRIAAQGDQLSVKKNKNVGWVSDIGKVISPVVVELPLHADKTTIPMISIPSRSKKRMTVCPVILKPIGPRI